MNEEIKGILDYLKDKNDYIEDFGISYKRIHIDNGDLKILLDYITNLQEENERLKEEIYFDNLNYTVQLKEWKDIVDEAIEYIQNDLIPYGDEWCWDDADIRGCVVELLNILQESDKE